MSADGSSPMSALRNGPNLAELSTQAAQTDNGGDVENQVVRIPWIMSLFIFLYSLIFLLGTTGNCLVAFVVIRNKAMQTITNIFITNLAISDILMCLLAVPFTPISFFLNTWVFGTALCHIFPMILCISVYVSTLTSTAIAVDRYFVIVYPFKPRMKVYMCLLMIIAIWIISISISLPLGIYHQVNKSNDSVYLCAEHWPIAQARQFFTVTSLVLHYIVPCVIISFCYIKVSGALRKRSKVKIGSGQRTREREEMEIKRNRRTNKMLIAMVVIFLLCWMPLNLTNLMRDANSKLDKWYYFTLIFFFAHVAAMSSTIYNPFLYAWMNDNFKKEFRHVLPCLFFSRGSSQSPTSYTQYTNVDTNQASVVLNRSPVKNGGGGVTKDCTVNMQPANNSNAGAMLMKDVKAYYDTDSEKVCLNVLNNTNSANHHNHQLQPRDAQDKQLKQPLAGRLSGPEDMDYAESGGLEQETAT